MNTIADSIYIRKLIGSSVTALLIKACQHLLYVCVNFLIC